MLLYQNDWFIWEKVEVFKRNIIIISWLYTDGLPTGLIFLLQIHPPCISVDCLALKNISSLFLYITLKIHFKLYFNIINSIVGQYASISGVLYNYFFSLDYNPFTYATTFTSSVNYHTIIDSQKDAQQRLFIHCAAEVFIMCYKLITSWISP